MDRTVLVTGVTRGIGHAVAAAFATDGATVVGCSRDATALADVVDELRAEGGTVEGVRADVRDEFDVERLAETAARIGSDGIDVVLANAGVYHGTPGETPIHDEPYVDFDDHLRTNARGVFATIRETLPHCNDDARVLVPTGSVAREAKPGIGSYAVSKAAAEAIARGFAADVEPIVGCVDPGQVDTELSGGPGRDPADVAELFVWAATEAEPDAVDGEIVGLREWRSATR